jgi:hypothetical protein
VVTLCPTLNSRIVGNPYLIGKVRVARDPGTIPRCAAALVESKSNTVIKPKAARDVPLTLKRDS